MQVEYYTIRVNTETEKFETRRNTEEGMRECLTNLRAHGYDDSCITVDETVELKTNKGRTYHLHDEVDVEAIANTNGCDYYWEAIDLGMTETEAEWYANDKLEGDYQ